jgi:integrase
MPATTPGIKQVELQGRKGRNGKRRKSVRYEVKAYSSATKRTEYVGRYETLTEAKDAKRRFEQAQGAGGRNRTRLTVRALVETHYLTRRITMGRVPKRIKDSTLKTNRYALAPFVATFGDKRIDRLSEDVIVAWCQTQPAHSVEGLRAMFAWAVKQRWIDESPLRFVDSRRTDGRKNLELITTAELEDLINAAWRCWGEVMGLRLSVLLRVLAYTGMRPSEAFALRPENISLAKSRIYVDWQLDERGVFQEVKNSQKRPIVLDPEVAAALKPLLAQVDGDDLLFRTARGKKFNCKGKWNYYWDPIRKSVGRNDMHVYELRHYCATLLLENDATPEQVALQLGHSDHGYLVRSLYGHPDKERQLEGLERTMRNRTVTIERRIRAEPPTVLAGDRSPAQTTAL